MKIYMYIAHMGAGGSERVCVNLANEFLEEGHEVHIITLNMDKHAYSHILSEKCKIHSLGVSRIRYSFLPLLKLLRKEKPESLIVFSHELLVWVNYLKKLHLIKTKIILRNQNNLELSYSEKTEISPVVQKILKNTCSAIRNADGVIAQCQAMKDVLVKDLNIDEKKIYTIYNPVSPDLAKSVIHKGKAKAKPKNIVYIGRLEPQKNVGHLLLAFQKVLQKRSDVTLHIVGDGYQRKEFENLVLELGINNQVVFEGIRKDIEHIYAKADVVALSSTYEGMPNTLIEAISLGIPVVSYDCPSGPAEIVMDDVNGYLAEYMNIDSLSDKLLKTLTKIWDADAIKETAKKFEARNVAKQYIEVLDKLNQNNPKKKKVAFYLGNLSKGGAERVVVNLAEYLDQQGYEVFIVTKIKGQDEFEVSPSITRILADIQGKELSHSRIVNFNRRIKKLQTIWKQIQPNIIVSFIGKNNFMSIVSAKKLHIPVVCSVRSAPQREYSGTMMKILVNPLFKRAAGIILQTRDAYDYFPKYIQKKSVIMPNPINPLFIRDRYEGIREDKIVTVGRIDKNKNQRLLVEAFGKIAKDFPYMKLELIGDGEDRKNVEELAKSLRIHEKVLFSGRQTEIYDKIYKSRIFVLPSIMEGMPNALIEAMALGLACVSTDCPCGGPKTIIDQNMNGILVPVQDAEQMAAALRTILDNPELEAELGRNAHKIGVELAPQKVNALWLDYIENIIQPSK